MSEARIFHAILRTDLFAFLQRVFLAVSPNDRFEVIWHLRAILYQLERCRAGDVKRLIITLPPRSGKSIAASVAFPAFILGQNPKARIITASYAESLATKFANDCRMVMQEPWYKMAFPRSRISSRKNTEQDFLTLAGGGRLSTSVGGPLTGRGADFIIADDLLKAEDAFSEAKRNQVYEWFKGTLLTRLNDKANGVVIVIAQRLHEDDLIGRLIDEGGWTVVNFPAIAVEDEWIDIAKDKRLHRREGQALQPAREPLNVLQDIRSEIGPLRFEAQYQQMPLPAAGNLVRAEWLRYYQEHQRPEIFDQIVQSWDTASTLGETASYSVCTTWGVHEYDIYLLDVFRKRLEFPDLCENSVHLAKAWRPNLILVEKAASGHQLWQTLRREMGFCIIQVPATQSKEARMEAQTAHFGAGRVLLPERASWLEEYRRELLGFPSTKYSDQVDSTSQALAKIGDALYRRMAARRRREQRDAAVEARRAASGTSGGGSSVEWRVPRSPVSIPFTDKITLL